MALFFFGVCFAGWFGWLTTGAAEPLVLSVLGMLGTLGAIWMEVKDV